jgi:hypothetical protein
MHGPVFHTHKQPIFGIITRSPSHVGDGRWKCDKSDRCAHIFVVGKKENRLIIAASGDQLVFRIDGYFGYGLGVRLEHFEQYQVVLLLITG